MNIDDNKKICSNRLHVLLITLHADPSLAPGIKEQGGGHMYPREIAEHLSQSGIQVSIFTRRMTSESPLIEENWHHPLITIYRLDYGNLMFLDKTDFYTHQQTSYILAKSLLESYELYPDLIHSFYWNSGFLAWQLSELLNVPYVHSPISLGAVIKQKQAKTIHVKRIPVETKVFQHAKYVLCITNSEKNDLIKFYNISAGKIYVIGRPIDKEYLSPTHDLYGNPLHSKEYKDNEQYEFTLTENEWWGRKAFLYVGRIHENKGLPFIIKAWLSLKSYYGEECPPLWVAGGTMQDIKDFLSDQNINPADSQKIVWWGYLSPSGISTLFLKTLAVIMHSKYEPGGRVSLEAMAAGIPVIATKCGFALDTIRSGENGFLVNYGDIKALEQTMALYIANPSLSYQTGKNARQTAKKIIEEHNFFASHDKIYKLAIGIIQE